LEKPLRSYIWLILWSFCAVVCASCADVHPLPSPTPSPTLACPAQFCRKAVLSPEVAGQCAAQTAREIEPFKALTLKMSFGEVCGRVGAPDWDAGSGLAISVYDLADGSRVLIGFAGPDQMMYIKRMFKDGSLETLIQ
jgi:hypothetical protein